MVPVGYPDEGTFEWLDGFLAKNPHYTELGDRSIIAWAEASGVWRNKQWSKGGSNDKPRYDFGLQPMDDFSIRSVLLACAPVFPRHYVVMEDRGNLLPQERAKVLQRFRAPCFRKVACVMMGEPPQDFKQRQHEKLLKGKQQKANQAFAAKKAEKARKKQAEERSKKVAQQRAEFELRRKKMAEEAKKKREEAEAKNMAEEHAKRSPEAADGSAGGDVEVEGEQKPKEGEETEEKAAAKIVEDPITVDVDEGAKQEEQGRGERGWRSHR